MDSVLPFHLSLIATGFLISRPVMLADVLPLDLAPKKAAGEI